MMWYKGIHFIDTLVKEAESKGIKNLLDHVGPQIEKEPHNHIGQGISFQPLEYHALYNKVATNIKFHMDDKRTLVGALAAGATKGTGFRSFGSPSVHIALDSERVNIHLDKTGFVHLHGNAGFYGPDCLQHIVNELVLAEKLGTPLHGRNWKLQSVLPTSSNKFKNVAGLQLTRTWKTDKSGRFIEVGASIQTKLTSLPDLGKGTYNVINRNILMGVLPSADRNSIPFYGGLFVRGNF